MMSRGKVVDGGAAGTALAAASIPGLCADELRLPLTPMTDPARRRLREEMRRFGLRIP